jgi:cell division cycle protein 37
MSGKPFDYSKWDRLEISDDEKDAHPNIDSSLMIRIKREQRARREAEEQMKIAELKKVGTADSLKQAEEIQRRSKLHVDNICRVVDEKTIVNKSAVASGVSADSSAEEDQFEEYVEKNEKALGEYASWSDLGKSEDFLCDNTQLLSEHACGWLLLQMLSLEMSGEREAMLNATRQYLMLRNILDLTKEAKRGNDGKAMIQLFFKQITGDKDRRALLDTETKNFSQQIIKRALEKKQEQNVVP